MKPFRPLTANILARMVFVRRREKKMSCLRSFAAMSIAISLAGCAGSGPYRNAGDDLVGDANQAKCKDLYQTTDAQIAKISTDFQASDQERIDFLARMHGDIKDTSEALKPCWESAYEHHESYDLYYAEFDDAGQATDIARGVPYPQSELRLIEKRVSHALDGNSNALLSLGHSFGALINFRALTPRLESGLNVQRCYRVFGFGDMTILLNPAFEGARYRALFNNAKTRPFLYGPYFGDTPPGACPGSTTTNTSTEVQIPSIVTLQSLGDTATGTFFPIFRRLTTPFLQTLSTQELTEKNQALGWVTDFRTHELALTSETDNAIEDRCVDPGKTYCPFRSGANAQTDRAITASGSHEQKLLLSREQSAGSQALPNYMPLWSVAVSADIMLNHDDIWNPQIVRLISVLLEDAYEQTERMHGQARN